MKADQLKYLAQRQKHRRIYGHTDRQQRQPRRTERQAAHNDRQPRQTEKQKVRQTELMTYRHTYPWTYMILYRRTGGKAVEQTNIHVNIATDTHTYGETDRWTEGLKLKQTDRD